VVTGLSFTVLRGQAVLLEATSPFALERLFAVLGGEEEPASGELIWNGLSSRAIAEAPGRAAAYRLERVRRLAVARLAPSSSLLHNQTLFDNIALPVRYHLKVPEHEAGERVERLLTRLGIEELAGARPSGLPHGVRRRAELARALVLGPALLIIEAHALGIDAASARVIVEVLREALAENRLGILGPAEDRSLLASLSPRLVSVGKETPCARR
jgi:ABC-type transporter Mla maintaining outer membrane lipid asymmetry ATPase subunit MlaF